MQHSARLPLHRSMAGALTNLVPTACSGYPPTPCPGRPAVNCSPLAAECLKELNETVAGSYVEEAPRSLVNSNPDFFRQFTLVIATQASPDGCLWCSFGCSACLLACLARLPLLRVMPCHAERCQAAAQHEQGAPCAHGAISC